MKEKIVALKINKKMQDKLLKTQMAINNVQMLKTKITRQEIKFVQKLMKNHQNREMDYIG